MKTLRQLGTRIGALGRIGHQIGVEFFVWLGRSRSLVSFKQPDAYRVFSPIVGYPSRDSNVPPHVAIACQQNDARPEVGANRTGHDDVARDLRAGEGLLLLGGQQVAMTGAYRLQLLAMKVGGQPVELQLIPRFGVE